jgi:hypothetical protein
VAGSLAEVAVAVVDRRGSRQVMRLEEQRRVVWWTASKAVAFMLPKANFFSNKSEFHQSSL